MYPRLTSRFRLTALSAGLQVGAANNNNEKKVTKICHHVFSGTGKERRYQRPESRQKSEGSDQGVWIKLPRFFTCVRVYMHMCAGPCGSQDSLQVIPQGLSTSFVWDKVSHWPEALCVA